MGQTEVTDRRWTPERTSASAAAAGLSQLLAIGTGVSHLGSAVVRPHRSAVAAGLLSLEGVVHGGAVAAAPPPPGGQEKKKRHEGGGEGEGRRGGVMLTVRRR